MSDILMDHERLAVRIEKGDEACKDGWWVTDGIKIYHAGKGGCGTWYDSAGSLIRFPSDGYHIEDHPNWAYMLEQLIWEGEIRHEDATYLYWRIKK